MVGFSLKKERKKPFVGLNQLTPGIFRPHAFVPDLGGANTASQTPASRHLGWLGSGDFCQCKEDRSTRRADAWPGQAPGQALRNWKRAGA